MAVERQRHSAQGHISHPTVQTTRQGTKPQIDSEEVRQVTKGALRSTRTPAALLALQRTVGNRAVGRMLANDRRAPATEHELAATAENLPHEGMGAARIQRHCYKAFTSYDDAKNANIYSQAFLNEQADDLINDHQRELFSSPQRAKIIQENKDNNDDEIISDGGDGRVLQSQDTTVTPHVDHRFPKSKGGTNSFANARVISAQSNISKGAKTTESQTEPTTALTPYASLDDSDHTIGKRLGFSSDQKKEIYIANKAHYGDNEIHDDVTGNVLTGMDSSTVAHIDHIVPKSKGGCNYYFNAQVLPADENIKKGGKRNASNDEDFATGQLTLRQYFAGEEYNPLDESSDEEDKQKRKKNKK